MFIRYIVILLAIIMLSTSISAAPQPSNEDKKSALTALAKACDSACVDKMLELLDYCVTVKNEDECIQFGAEFYIMCLEECVPLN